MFKFLRSLFGFDKLDLKDTGVQLERAPYKVESTVEPLVVDAIIEEKQVSLKPAVLAKTVMRKPRKPRPPKKVD